ncbi:hypothetical protein AB0D66_18405 [Streptomyces sp. NPDC048270]|uniref:hypothetical protein n=1 Tax=Streptomyces sp. NPDC048270 TaxID=3154615 RepID=UPI0033CCA931
MNTATVGVWPFALTRSVKTGFRVVVAPDFLVDAGSYSLLHDATGGDVDESAVYVREHRGHGTGPLWLLYRVVHLKAADVGLDGEYAMNGPRRTPLVEGIVCRTPPKSLATQELFAEVHRRCAAEVREFFVADTTTRPVTRSRAFSASATGVALQVVEPAPVEGSPLTAVHGRRPSRARRLATRLLSAVLRSLGLRPGRQGASLGSPRGHGRGQGPVPSESVPREGTPRTGPHWPLRAARTAGLIALGVVVVFVIRKFK